MRRSAGDVWFIEITNAGKGQQLKNAASRRLIPLHPTLVRLGLASWRDRLEREGFDRLFPELLHDPVKGYSKAAVKWFSAFLARMGWPRDGRKTFHSFRHTFASHCLNKLRLTVMLVSQLTGHKQDATVLLTVYRKPEPPHELVKAIADIDFALPDISPFDQEAGIRALRDALLRKNRGRGSA